MSKIFHIGLSKAIYLFGLGNLLKSVVVEPQNVVVGSNKFHYNVIAGLEMEFLNIEFRNALLNDQQKRLTKNVTLPKFLVNLEL